MNPVSDKKLQDVRHSLAHLLASAALEFDPKAQLGIGPTTEDGFYYDIKFTKPLTEAALPKLEAHMRELARAKIPFAGQRVSFAEARKLFRGQPFKLELLGDLKRYGTTDWQTIEAIRARQVKAKRSAIVTVYRSGNFTDLCRGGHVKTTQDINAEAFKLIRIAGAYWRGDEKKPMLTRIYGVAFLSRQELEAHLEQLAAAEQFNHRVLGEQLSIFLISEKVGKGLPILLPKGEVIKHELQEYLRRKELAAGYKYVATPVLASGKLYEASGHKHYFGDEMYRFTDPEGQEFFIKPMNCPHHHMVYQKLVQSYRDLPLRLAEAGPVYRFERSGVVYGLVRVRGPITQNDAHLYVTQDDLAREFTSVVRLLREVYADIGVIRDSWFRLSLPDFRGKNKDKFGGGLKLWQDASKIIRDVCKAERLDAVETTGEAAFYGPKLDLQIRNIYGKEESIATVQIDILIPRRMGLVYIDAKGKEQYPFVIHRALIGSYERFIGFLLEATRGDLPLWLAPVQVVILPINDKQQEYAKRIHRELVEHDLIRAELWPATESLSKRILRSEQEKITYAVVIGDREIQQQQLSIRRRKVGDQGASSLEAFVAQLESEIRRKGA